MLHIQYSFMLYFLKLTALRTFSEFSFIVVECGKILLIIIIFFFFDNVQGFNFNSRFHPLHILHYGILGEISSSCELLSNLFNTEHICCRHI